MINKVLSKLFGTKHERDLKRMQPIVQQVNALESSMEALDDGQLRAKTDEFRGRLENGETTDDLMLEAFAVVREAAKRQLGMRHYDVQLIGGMVLHDGRIAEMKTGEGKTLMATLAVYLNALPGKGTHVVTVNDYLAQRDAEWMAPVYEALGMSVGVIKTNLPTEDRRKAYACDITYATNNELGFDYLRDHMVIDQTRMVQRGHHFAIVDEVDSILIDEARTPLIISGPSEESVDKYYRIDRVIPKFVRGDEHEDENGNKYTSGDFLVDEKAQTVALTEEGVAKAEHVLKVENLYDMENIELLHGVNQGLRAHHLYKNDVDYLVKDGSVVIVDEFTGRAMPGRRWSDGLHQAVEAKEGVRIERENQTLATVTFQNYFRMYDKLAGMTGTAETEEAEFGEIYELDVTVIPTNKPIARMDYADAVFRTEPEKWQAVVDELQDCQERGQPVLVGTVSIENSEMLSKMLKKRGVRHVVLNAKFHEREATIVAQAGRKGSVTIATNMAGRGTDIVLGGNAESLARNEVPDETDTEAYEEALARLKETTAKEREEVKAAGGLHILGTERHESRRIDNQLRGRSGRQGDPGSSRFFISLDDNLMRIFGDNTQRVQNLMGKLGMEDGEAIEHKMVSRAIERAQGQVEGRNFEVRKQLLKYDDVMNKQREAVYELRDEVLTHENADDSLVKPLTGEIIEDAVERHCAENLDPRDWNLTELATEMLDYFDVDIHKVDDLDLEALGVPELKESLTAIATGKYETKEERHGLDQVRPMEREVFLKVLDDSWKNHLLALDHLKEGIHLRGHGQRDPLNEYKRESFELFTEMKNRYEDTAIRHLYRLEPMSAEEREARRQAMIERMRQQMRLSAASTNAAPTRPATVQRKMPKVGRNDPCPCGSGKKYKKCHGAPQRRTA
ncbi:MAG: preprotein translocase subunit SecA [Acidobacteriota bacterium]